MLLCLTLVALPTCIKVGTPLLLRPSPSSWSVVAVDLQAHTIQLRQGQGEPQPFQLIGIEVPRDRQSEAEAIVAMLTRHGRTPLDVVIIDLPGDVDGGIPVLPNETTVQEILLADGLVTYEALEELPDRWQMQFRNAEFAARLDRRNVWSQSSSVQ